MKGFVLQSTATRDSLRKGIDTIRDWNTTEVSLAGKSLMPSIGKCRVNNSLITLPSSKDEYGLTTEHTVPADIHTWHHFIRFFTFSSCFIMKTSQK